MGYEVSVEELPGVLPVVLRNKRGNLDSVEVDEYEHFTVYSTENQRVISTEESFTRLANGTQTNISNAYDYLKGVSGGARFLDAAREVHGRDPNGSFGRKFGQMFPGKETLPPEYRREISEIAENHFKV